MKRKVSVCCQVTYQFEYETNVEKEQIPWDADTNDPVYKEICKILTDNHLNHDGIILSIVDEETDEILFQSD